LNKREVDLETIEFFCMKNSLFEIFKNNLSTEEITFFKSKSEYPEMKIVDNFYDFSKGKKRDIDIYKRLNEAYDELSIRFGYKNPSFIPCLREDNSIYMNGLCNMCQDIGKFCFKFPNGKEIIESNVFLVRAYFQTVDGLKCFQPSFVKQVIYEEELDKLVYIIFKNREWVIGNTGKRPYAKMDVYVYYGSGLYEFFKSVDTEFSFIEPGNYFFSNVEKADENEIRFIKYIEGKAVVLHKGKENFYIERNNGLKEENSIDYNIIENDLIKINFFLDGSKASIVFNQFCKDRAEKILELDPLISEDATKNYCAYFKIENVQDIRFAYYCLCKSAFLRNEVFGGVGFFGVSLARYKKQVLYSKLSYILKLSKLKINESDDIFYLLRELYLACDEEFNMSKLPSKCEKLPTHDDVMKKLSYYLISIRNDSVINKNEETEFKKMYRNYFDDAVRKGDAQTKWISEYRLYEMVKIQYPDAIYQYHDKWLGNQSLDVFIPSKNIGIEYQGEQHYFPISLFGGEKGFLERKQLDDIKREKCKEYNINLLEWKYCNPITSNSIKREIAQMNSADV